MTEAELHRQIEWLRDDGRMHLDRETVLRTFEWCEREIRRLRQGMEQVRRDLE